MKYLSAILTSTVISGFGCLPLPTNAATIIDNFNSGRIVHSQLAPSMVEGVVVPNSTDAIAPRNYWYLSTASEKETLLPSGFSTNGLPAVFSISNAPSTTSIVRLKYQGDFNLASNGETILAFDVLNNDLGVNVAIVINDVFFNIPLQRQRLGLIEIPFTSFPDVDFQDVTSIELVVNGPDDYDFVLDNFRTELDIESINEPSFILSTLGLAVVLAVGKIKTT